MKSLTVIFWIHQIIFGLASLGSVGDLLFTGGTSGQLNVIPLLLAWIAGSLTWGLGAALSGMAQHETAAPPILTPAQ